MNLFAQQNPPLGLYIFIFFGVAIVAAFLMSWAAIIERLFSRKPILPYQPRRRVPWRIWDLLAILFFYVFISAVVLQLCQYLSGVDILETSKQKSVIDHPLVQLMAERNWAAIILCCLTGIIVAPIAEEAFHRILIQGWLENVDRNMRRRVPPLRRLLPPAAAPILISSLFFAARHFRTAAPQKSAEVLFVILISNALVNIISLFFAIVWVRYRAGATALDFGWDPKKFLADVRLGLIAFAAISVPLYGCQIVLAQIIKILVENYKVLPKEFAPDPIPIFFFAVVLGLLYYRTHRAAPSIALHMALNASSLAVLLFWGAK
jgi:membrane protease YdiL (CAAX protease family)